MLDLCDEAYYMSLYCLFNVTGCCFHRPSNTVSNLLSVFAGWREERQDRAFLFLCIIVNPTNITYNAIKDHICCLLIQVGFPFILWHER